MALLARQPTWSEPPGFETQEAVGPGAAPRWTRRLPSLPSLGRRRSSGSAASVPPPPLERVALPLQLADGEEVLVQAAADSSLEEVLQKCGQAAGVPALLLSLIVQGEARCRTAPCTAGRVPSTTYYSRTV